MDLPNIHVRLSPSQAAKAVGVSKQLLNYWRATGRIQPGADGLYDYLDVLTAERETRRSRYSHRGITPATAS